LKKQYKIIKTVTVQNTKVVAEQISQRSITSLSRVKYLCTVYLH